MHELLGYGEFSNTWITINVDEGHGSLLSENFLKETVEMESVEEQTTSATDKMLRLSKTENSSKIMRCRDESEGYMDTMEFLSKKKTKKTKKNRTALTKHSSRVYIIDIALLL